jgi:CTP:molybdopterin cytidylyltransferase MocA
VKLAAVILAAGSGTRLGGVAKALLRVGSETYLERIVATAREVGLDEAIVVVGPPFGEVVAEHATRLGLRVAVNPEPSRGMASSVAIGFASLGDADAAWLWPVDHPFVDASTLRALIAANAIVAQPRYAGQGGHPPLVARALWPLLATCGESGARAVLAPHATAISVADAGVIRDVDTLEASRPEPPSASRGDR